MSRGAFIELINSCVQDVECLPAYSTSSDSLQDARDKCIQLAGSTPPTAFDWAYLIHSIQVRYASVRPRLLQPSKVVTSLSSLSKTQYAVQNYAAWCC
jgi:hypothetical protein